MISFKTFLSEAWDNSAYHAGLPIQPGKPFNYHRRTAKAPRIPKHVHDFGQDIEPHGRYMNYSTETEHSYMTKNPFSGVENGQHTFHNPLYVHYGQDENGGDAQYSHPNNWKQVLSRHFKAKGKALSKKIAKAGYDGIVTVKSRDPKKYGHHSELVDLSMFKEH